METPETKTTPATRSFTIPNVKLSIILRYGTVTSLVFAGIGLMAGGCAAWMVGEEGLFFSCFVAGAIFIASGALGFLKCLDVQ